MQKKLACVTSLWLAAVGCGGDGTPVQTGNGAMVTQPASGAAAPASAAGTRAAGATTPQAGARAAAAGATTSVGAAGATGSAGHSGATGYVAGAAAAAGATGAAGSNGVAPAAGSGGAAGMAAAGSSAGVAGGSSAGEAGAPSAGAAGVPSTGAVLDAKQTLIPHKSWDCGMPEGLPGLTGALLFDAEMEVGDIHDLGDTQFGHRHQIDINGGKVTGSKLNAEILERGLDYQLVLANGAVEVEQINILRTSDRALIYVRTCGTAVSPNGDVRIAMDFEAPNSSAYAFLNTGKFVGTREFDLASKTLKIHVYEAGAPDVANALRVEDPDGVPDQTWDCKVAMGSKGATVYTESVGIGGGSLSVGESKRGNRNIIPITGGTTTGRVVGTVLSGGADFQIIANGTFSHLDARYSLLTNDGEVIIVRNCGPIGALVPVFEASKDGKYAWINANTWLSSDPGLGLGAVNLTIYETR